MSREVDAELSGRILSRDERKKLLIEDLLDCTESIRADLLAESHRKIAHNEEYFARQDANGMGVTAETLRRNNSRHALVIECLNEIATATHGVSR